MPKIFFCYRREDSTHQAGRIFDALAAHFGKHELFKDLDSMRPGQDFRRALSEQVEQCDTLLALIGDAWLNAADPAGGRRLDNPTDFVRIEIESALRRSIPVVPVLVGHAPVPEAGDLPEGMRELAFRHGIPVRPDPDFHNDVERLIRGINEVLGGRDAPAGAAAAPPPALQRAKAPAAATPPDEGPKSGRVAALGAHSRSFLEKLKTATGPPGGPTAVAPAAPPLQREVAMTISKERDGERSVFQPGSVFISFKHLDAHGQETKDCQMARRIAGFLGQQGILVFFSPDSLERSGKSAYKKAIDEALDGATVLVAVGTSRENLESEWVRYEWDGFLNDIISGLKPKGEIFSVIDGVAARELPRGLRQRQVFSYDDDGIVKLANFIRHAINAVLDGGAAPAGAPAAPPPALQRATAPADSMPPAEGPKSELVTAMGAHSRSYVEKLKTATGAPGAPAAAAPPPPERTVRVGILKSGNATYVNDIEHALLASLNTRLAGQRVRLAPSLDCVEWGEEAQWPTTVARLVTRGGREGFRFLVAIGTQAAVALHHALGPEFGKVPTLLLGVTYPRIAGLVESEHFRCESRQVTCVRYGCGLDAVASLLHDRIVPGRRLCFVFQAGIPQDEMACAELSTTRLAREGLLRLLRLERRLQAEDLEDKDTVYFSWYTFTRLFHEKEFSILRERLTVSIMQDNVRDGAAAVGVGTDHDWIGDRGAELIAEHHAAPVGAKPDWGSRDVAVSPLVYWLNRGLAKKHGIEFSQAALAGAGEVYD